MFGTEQYAPTGATSLAPAAVPDYDGFARELQSLRREMEASLGPADVAHLRKFERWGRLCTGLGYASAWLLPNPISAVLIAQGNTTRWTIMMHHVGHRGYDRVPGALKRYTSRGFATGWRRFVDWPDWMAPQAWCYEHNVLHHGRTGELADPDLVEENLQWLRRSKMPLVAKYGVVAFFAMTWKFSYYAPNTFERWQRARPRQQGGDGAMECEPVAAPTLSPETEPSFAVAFDLRTADGRAFWKTCILPYAIARFGAIPALFTPLGPWAVASVVANSAAAEIIANVQSFLLIAPNHAGDDICRFSERASGRKAFYVRQVIGSVNYQTGSDLVDFLLGGLNYQIEHHLFPDLPLRTYQQYQPRVKAICARYGVPYRQDGLFRRVRKLLDIMVGKTSMSSVSASEISG